ncbi:MAG: helix-turn-helix transcriptional regulator [Clostridia bacterium]|nr:helix-turn-helix transcriptional regulator [Clostridia bacterium]
MTFGERLKKIRTERGLRQEDIGKVVHVGKSTVSQWESNTHVPDLETVAKIADHLNISIDYLLGRTDNPVPPVDKNRYETLAAHRRDDPIADLPPEAQRSLEEFKEYIIKKYGQKKE